MKNSRDGKSYSTNLAFTPPEYLRTGIFCLAIIDFISPENKKKGNTVKTLNIQIPACSFTDAQRLKGSHT